ncbi:uncharacterized protein LOC121794989 [Salvia splendens]|uniref:uncharacterized protein LOC121794989 n=1 Tax=Salvia splendens TaxID=180675 RepID=UPI001C276AA1|nr:uncharacterized protein LOC121794989 [Salvia splendens]
MAQTLEDCVGPKTRKKIEKLKSKVGDCLVREAGEWLYQVNTKVNEQFVVNLRERTCSCRRWMLTGLPCPHACAAIQSSSETVESFIPTCYSMETFRQVYAGGIYPLHGPDMWPKTPHPDIVPPDLRRLPGRPKGSRMK